MTETNRSTLHAIYNRQQSATQGSNDTHIHCHAGKQQLGLAQRQQAANCEHFKHCNVTTYKLMLYLVKYYLIWLVFNENIHEFHNKLN